MRIKIRCLGFCLASLFCAAAVFAQSGNTENKVPVREIAPPEASVPGDEIPTPKAFYEYLAPQNIRSFMMALKEAGRRGFRLDKMTSLPGAEYETSRQKAGGLVLAGILKYDGESRFDYNFFFAEGEENPETTLNDLAKEGWYFLDVLSVAGTGDDDSLPIEDIFANRLRKLPTLGNIYVLERRDDKKTARVYKLLKAGVGTGRNPTPKLQGLLDQALAEGFVPVGSYFSFDIKSLFSVDSFSGILVEKRDGEAKKYEYKFVRGNWSNGLWKDIEEVSKQGFRLESLNLATAILVREPGSNAPVSYTRLITGEKTFQADLAAALAKNPAFLTASVYAQGVGELNKNLLVFENTASAAELKLVKILPVIPKQFKKNPQEFLKTVEKPEIVFQKALDEGFQPRDLYFSNREGLSIVFARDKKQ